MPSHRHGITTWKNSNSETWGEGAQDNFAFANVASAGDGTSQSAENFLGINYSGMSSSHNNIQPSIGVLRWHRTA